MLEAVKLQKKVSNVPKAKWPLAGGEKAERLWKINPTSQHELAIWQPAWPTRYR